ncbi:hypothetical protein PFISCL1PPCAC_4736, partial [Pristionchus fissidentatus]
LGLSLVFGEQTTVESKECFFLEDPAQNITKKVCKKPMDCFKMSMKSGPPLYGCHDNILSEAHPDFCKENSNCERVHWCTAELCNAENAEPNRNFDLD